MTLNRKISGDVYHNEEMTHVRLKYYDRIINQATIEFLENMNKEMKMSYVVND